MTLADFKSVGVAAYAGTGGFDSHTLPPRDRQFLGSRGSSLQDSGHPQLEGALSVGERCSTSLPLAVVRGALGNCEESAFEWTSRGFTDPSREASLRCAIFESIPSLARPENSDP